MTHELLSSGGSVVHFSRVTNCVRLRCLQPFRHKTKSECLYHKQGTRGLLHPTIIHQPLQGSPCINPVHHPGLCTELTCSGWVPKHPLSQAYLCDRTHALIPPRGSSHIGNFPRCRFPGFQHDRLPRSRSWMLGSRKVFKAALALPGV